MPTLAAFRRLGGDAVLYSGDRRRKRQRVKLTSLPPFGPWAASLSPDKVLALVSAFGTLAAAHEALGRELSHRDASTRPTSDAGPALDARPPGRTPGRLVG